MSLAYDEVDRREVPCGGPQCFPGTEGATGLCASCAAALNEEAERGRKLNEALDDVGESARRLYALHGPEWEPEPRWAVAERAARQALQKLARLIGVKGIR